MAQLESGSDEPDWNNRLNSVIDLDQCRTVYTTWNEEEEVEYGLHIALSSIRGLNPVAVETETRKSFDSNGDLVEETEIVSLGELFLDLGEPPESDSDALDPYTKSDSRVVDCVENVVSSIDNHLRLIFDGEGIDSDFVEVNSHMTVTFTLATGELRTIIDPENELNQIEGRQLLSEIATNENIDSRISAPQEHRDGELQEKYAIERDLRMGFEQDSTVITPEVVLDAIDDIHNGVFNNKQTVALTLSMVNNIDMTQTKIAGQIGVTPSVVSVQLQDAKNEIERAQHTTNKYNIS